MDFLGQRKLPMTLAAALLLPLSLAVSLWLSTPPEAAAEMAVKRSPTVTLLSGTVKNTRSPINKTPPKPEPPPEPTPEPTLAERRMAEMTLEQKLWQLMLVHPTDLSAGSLQSVREEMAEALSSAPVGGFFFNAKNMKTREQITAMNRDLQALGADLDIPGFFTVCDEEGGRVARLMTTVGTRRIGPMLQYEKEGGITAFQNAEIIGEDMASCGFNLDFAPVADVWSNPKNSVIGDRAYSTDFETAAWLVKNAVYGFHSGGVACTLKHFPGHGDTAEDSHSGAAYVHKTLDELRAQEFLPFKAGIQAGADLVMVGHITVPAVSEEPALFSPALLGLLREELGFEGVIVTDALEMGAVGGYTPGETAVKAIAAGVDLLLCPTDLEGTVAALREAVADGTLTEERIDQSVLRILTVKEARGLLG